MTTRPESKSSVSHHRMPHTATTAPLINYPFLSLNLRNTSNTAIPQYIVHALGSNSSYERVALPILIAKIVLSSSAVSLPCSSTAVALQALMVFHCKAGLVSELAAVVIFSGLLRPWQGSYSPLAENQSTLTLKQLLPLHR